MNCYRVTIYSPDGTKAAEWPIRVYASCSEEAQDWIDSLVSHGRPVPTDIVREPEPRRRKTK
jgi:hypothetical protein